MKSVLFIDHIMMCDFCIISLFIYRLHAESANPGYTCTSQDAKSLIFAYRKIYENSDEI